LIAFFYSKFTPVRRTILCPHPIKAGPPRICQAFIPFFIRFFTAVRRTILCRTQLKGDWRGFVKLLSLKMAVEHGWLMKPPLEHPPRQGLIMEGI